MGHLERVAASVVPRVAVIGAGYWGKNLVRNFAALGALEAIVDSEDDVASKMIAAHGGRRATLGDVFVDKTVDAVAIATPAVSHYQLAKDALKAGKHVFVEKPMALDLKQAEELCNLSESAQLRLMVGHLLQYHPAFVTLKDLVGKGELGQLQYIYSNRLNFGLIRREEDILWSFAPHDVSMILSLIGKEPVEVEAVGGCFLHPTIADVTTTHMRFPDGQRAHIFVSWLHPFKEQKLVVVGRDAMAVFDDGEPWESKLVIYRHKTEWSGGIPRAVKADGESRQLTQGEPLGIECRHFLDSIVNGMPPRTDGREGMRVLSVLTRATASLQRTQSVFPVPKPRFPGVTVHESSYVDEDVTIGEGTKIWHFSHILGHCHIGRNVVIGQNVVIGPDVTVGDRCKIQNNVSVYKGVTLEEGVFCGPSCVFTNVNNPRAEIERKSEFRPTLVKRGATIGANATIVCGSTLGEYCFIAAGAVVTRDVPAFAMMRGVPAKRVGWVGRSGDKLSADLVCPTTGSRFRLLGVDGIEEIVETATEE